MADKELFEVAVYRLVNGRPKGEPLFDLLVDLEEGKVGDLWIDDPEDETAQRVMVALYYAIERHADTVLVVREMLERKQAEEIEWRRASIKVVKDDETDD